MKSVISYFEKGLAISEELPVLYLVTNNIFKAKCLDAMLLPLANKLRNCPSAMTNKNIQLLLGRIYRSSKHFDDAEVHLKQIIAVDPNYAAARLHLIGVFMDQKLYRPALAHVDEYLERFPDDDRVRKARIVIARLLAESNITTLLMQPATMNDEATQIQIGIDFVAAENFPEAEKFFKRAIILNRASAAHFHLIELYRIQNNVVTGLFAVLKALEYISDPRLEEYRSEFEARLQEGLEKSSKGL